MKIRIFSIIILFMPFIGSCGMLSYFLGEKITYESPRKPLWEITLEGPFSSTKTVKPNEIIFKYYGRHKYYPKKINYFSQYTFLGKVDRDTIELEYREGGAIVDNEKDERVKVHLFKRRLYNRFPLKTPALYTTCKKKDVVLLEMISLSDDEPGKEELEYRIILPDCLDEVIRMRMREREEEKGDSDVDDYF